MNFLLFFYGLFFSLPLVRLNLFIGGVKFDDFILALLTLSIFTSAVFNDKKLNLNKHIFSFVIITFFFASIAFYRNYLNFEMSTDDDNIIVFLRVIQSLMIFLVIGLIKGNDYNINFLYKGLLSGSSLSLILFLFYFFSHFDLTAFSSRGVYFTKDIFQYNEDSPFSIHVNTLGSLFLISFFILYFNLKRNRILAYLFIIPSLLLISKGDMLAVLAFLGFKYFLKSQNKIFMAALFFIIFLALSPKLYDEYLSLAQYRLYPSGRDELYTGAFEGIIRNPLGYGLGSQSNILYNITGIDYPAHNFFLSIGIEFGVFYLIYVIFSMSVWFFKFKGKTYKYVLITYLIIGFFGNAMYFYKFHALAIAITILGVWRASGNENTYYVK